MADLNDGLRTVLIANPGADLYGSDRMVLETVTAMRANGWRVVVTVPQNGQLVPELRDRGAVVEMCRTPVVRKSALNLRGALALLRDVLAGLMPGISTVRRVRPDVVYVSTVTIPLWIFIARFFGATVVCHIHEGEGTVRRAVLKCLNAPLFLAHAIIINSQFSKDVLGNAFSSLAARAHVVYNYVPGPAIDRPARDAISDQVRLVFVGRLSARKGPDVAVEALALLRDRGVSASLDIVGDVFPGNEGFRRELEERISALGLNNVTKAHGFHREGWGFLANADIALVPSTVDEPFGNTAVEAALAGRPSVVSDVGGLPEASSGVKSAVMVEANNPLAIADAVVKIVENWDEYRSLSAHDAAFAASKYSARRYADELLEIMERPR